MGGAAEVEDGIAALAAAGVTDSCTVGVLFKQSSSATIRRMVLKNLDFGEDSDEVTETLEARGAE